MKTIPYWRDTAPAFADSVSGPIEGDVDVAVIGGGFTGMSAALALAQRGANVVVLEADQVMSGASGRNGGHVNNGTSVDVGAVAASYGLDSAKAIYHAFDDAVDSVERIVREQEIDCKFQRCGKIKLANKPAHFEKMENGFAILSAIDPTLKLIPATRIRTEVGSDAFHGGILYPKSAQMHMGLFGIGLARAAARSGARIFETAPVTGLQRLGSGAAHRVTTPRGTLQARQVLVATGPSRKGPFSYFRRRIVPVGSFIIATAPLSDDQKASIMPTGRVATTSNNIGNYFRITHDNRLIFGGRARFALSSPTSDLTSGKILQAGLRETFPQIADVPIDYCWGGIVDMTQDRLPRAGEHDGLFYAMGYSGHGAQMSVHMGQRMAAVLGGDAAANPLRALPWPAVPGHFGPPWFLPFVGAYYRFKDWVG